MTPVRRMEDSSGGRSDQAKGGLGIPSETGQADNPGVNLNRVQILTLYLKLQPTAG